MMIAIRNLMLAGFAALMLAFSASVMAAHAGDPMIDAAKDQGLIGEQADGYLGAVTSLDAALKRKMDEINTRRRELYTQVASEQGQSLSTIAQISGKKLVEGESSGRYVYDDTGSWVKIP